MSSLALASGRHLSAARDRLAEAVSLPALAIIGMLLLIARRPEAIFRAEFNWEEANAFFVPTFFVNPLSLLIEPWGGTLQVIPRLGYQALRAVPVYWAPLAENLLAFGGIVAVAAFIASDRISGAIPDRVIRLALATMLFVLPGQGEVIGTFVNVQWHAALWLAILPIASTPITNVGRWVERVIVLLAALTGPFAMLLAPVYLWRLRSHPDPHFIWLSAIVSVGGVLQLASILASGRVGSSDEIALAPGLTTLWLHTTIVPVVGERLSNALVAVGPPTEILLLGATLLTAALAATAWRIMSTRLVPLAYGGVAVAITGIAVHTGQGIWRPGVNERYFLLASVVVVLVIIVGVARRHVFAPVLAALLTLGVVADFRLTPHPAQGWPETHACIGQAEACVVPIWPHDYDVYWPGADGTYEMPEHYDP
jgi:hypothetical protein